MNWKGADICLFLFLLVLFLFPTFLLFLKSQNGNKVPGRGQPGPECAMDGKRNPSFSKLLGHHLSICPKDPRCYPGIRRTVVGHRQRPSLCPSSLFLVSLVTQGPLAAQSSLKSLNMISRAEILPSIPWVQGAMCHSGNSVISIKGDTQMWEGDLYFLLSICLTRKSLFKHSVLH